LGEPSHGVENLIGCLGPHEGLEIRMMRVDELANGGLQLGHTAMGAAPQLFIREFGEPAFNEVQPGAVGRGKCTWKRGRFASQFLIKAVLCVP
jgi:hypothetical protein